jgi:geranylgeranyl pyrophosphate synthase
MDSPLGLLGVPEMPDLLAAVDTRLVHACSAGEPAFSAACVRVVSGGGKRLRPALTLAIADMAGASGARVIAAAAAVELVQVGSLVHDDIFDEALTRRGTPTINAVEGETEALLAGTFMLARAATEATTAGQAVAADVARTVGRLCVGQAIETRHLFDVDQELDRYLLTIEAKTAALFGCSCRVGGLSADLPSEQIVALGEFGRNFGMAFQIIDDVLDLVGDPARLGKPVGADIRNGVLTMPVLLELADRRDSDLRALLVRREPADLEQASRVTVGSGRVDEAIEAARAYATQATDAISRLPGAPLALCRFPGSYVNWALEEFSAA